MNLKQKLRLDTETLRAMGEGDSAAVAAGAANSLACPSVGCTVPARCRPFTQGVPCW